MKCVRCDRGVCDGQYDTYFCTCAAGKARWHIQLFSEQLQHQVREFRKKVSDEIAKLCEALDEEKTNDNA